MAYYFYLDKLLLPIAPSKLQIKINGQNKTLTLINDGEINILKKAKLTNVDFDVLIPQVKYPFAIYKDGFHDVLYYLDKLEALKSGQEPFQFIVTRTLPNGKMLFGTNMKVSLEDYKINEDSKNGLDLMISINLKQYKDYGTKTVNVKISDTTSTVSIVKTRPAESSPAPKTTAKTHTVVKGDTLWGIAKKYYGNGNLYPKIYNANKDKVSSPNSINVGQVLTIPI